MKTTITKIAAVVMTVLLASFTTYADIVVTAQTVTICPGTSQAVIAFNVTGAQNLGSISMKVSVNHSVLFNTPFTFQANPALQTGGFVTGNVTANPPYVIAFAWFGTSGATIPDGESMVTFTVPYLGGTSPLNFLNVGIDCVISDGNGVDIPTTWINGSVSPTPALSINTQPQNITVTQGTDAVFSVDANIASTYLWQESTDGGNSWNDLTEGAPYSGVATASLTVAQVPASYDTYQYRCNITAPCSQAITSDAALLNVSTFIPLPTAFDMSGGGSICEGGTGLSFTLSGSEADVTYELYLNDVATGIILSGTGDPLSFDNITAAGTYTIIGTNTYGSTPMNGSGTLVVNLLPVVTLDAIPPACSYTAEVILTDGTPAGGTFSGTTITDHTFYPSVAGAGTYPITYTYTDGNGCTSSVELSITVNEAPVVSLNLNVSTICTSSAPVELAGGLPEGGVYTGPNVENGYFYPALAGQGDFTITYTYTDANACFGEATAVITVLVTETFDVTGGGTFCEGTTGASVGLTNSETISSYELYLNDAPTGNILAGTGSALDFGLQTAAGTYTVKATNVCGTFDMNGNAVISVTPLPTIYNIDGGGLVCDGVGVNITLSGSDNSAMYFVFNGPDMVASLPGDGNPLTFGPFTTAGTYTIFGEYNIDCASNMAGEAVITTGLSPAVFNVTGGGEICPTVTGISVGLDGSETGVSYELYLDDIGTGISLAGTGDPLDFGSLLTDGTYTVFGSNGCGNIEMTGNAVATLPATITIHEQPIDQNINSTSNAIFYITTNIPVQTQWQESTDGGTTWNDLIESSMYNGVNSSSLIINNVPVSMNGNLYRCELWTDNCVVYTYQVSNAAILNVTEIILPIQVSVPHVSDAIAGNQVVIPVSVTDMNDVAAISLSLGFDPAVVTYNGYQNENSLLAGGMLLINPLTDHIKFGWFSVTPISLASGVLAEYLFTFNGGYTDLTWDMTPGECQFTNLVPTILPSDYTNGSITGTCPLPQAYNVTGGGSYCAGSEGVHVGLDNSEVGVNYELFHNYAATGIIIPGTGSNLDFGPQTESEIYTVVGTNLCGTTDMYGNAMVNVLQLPYVATVSGDITACPGTYPVFLDGSEPGVSYELYKDGLPTGILYTGDGNPLTVNVNEAGVYSFFGTNTCGTVEMNGSATISFIAGPLAFEVTGGGILCSGDAGFSVTISGSETGILYRLFLDGTLNVASLIGNGSPLTFNPQNQAGAYTVVAYGLCNNVEMNGSATITLQDAIAFTSQPADVTVQAGENADYSVTTNFDGIYQWEVSTDGGNTFTPLTDDAMYAGSTTNHLSITAVTADMNGYAYHCSAIDPFCGISSQVFSDPAFLTVTTIPSNIIVTAPSIDDAIPGTQVVVPITVENVSNAASISLSLGFDPAVLNYVGYQNVAVDESFLSVNVIGNSVKFAWFSIVPVSIPSGTLVEYIFNFVEGYSPLTWDLTPGACQFTDLTPLPLDANFVDGHVTGTCPLPVAFNVTGGGSYCPAQGGIEVGLNGSETATNYELFLDGITTGTIIAGDGNALSFGLITAAGTYTVVATNSCGSTDMIGSAVVNFPLPEPGVFEVGGTLNICAGNGTPITLSGSETDVTYELYLDGVATGTTLAGTGSALSFDNQTSAGTYTVYATNVCGTVEMNGNAVIAIIPDVEITTQPADVTIQVGENAEFFVYTNTPATLWWQVSTDGGLTFTDLTNTPPYSSVNNYHMYITGATLDMNGYLFRVAYNSPCGSPVNYSDAALLSVTALPTIIVTAPSIDDAVPGNPVIVPITAENLNGVAAISLSLGFDPAVLTYVGLQSINPLLDGGMLSVNLLGSNVKLGWFSITPISLVSGTLIEYVFTFNEGYSPLTWDLTPGECEFDDIVPAALPATFVNGHVTGGCDLPLAFDVNGGGIYCAGDAGVVIGLAGSETGTSYELFLDGVTTGYIVSGDGNAISFGNQALTGNYTVVATNPCGSTDMNGAATVSTYVAPAVFDVTGGGSYCAGGSGVNVGLSGSETGISYELYLDGTATGNILTGDGNPLDFGVQMSAGTYTIVAGFVCGPVVMNGNAVVIINTPVFTAFNVTGGGSYCAGGAGVSIGLDGSETAYTYELYLDGTATGNILTGTGNALDFGVVTTIGTYTVNAIDLCGNSFMNGNAVVSVYTTPSIFTVTGGGNYCSGGTGVVVGLDGSETGLVYELYLDGTTTGLTVTGDGAALSFGLLTSAGTYTVEAAFVCGPVAMTGNAVISINTPVFTAFNVTGGGSYCAGGAGVSVGLDGSETAYTYELYLDGTASGNILAGTGSALDFGVMTTTGTYTVNAIDPCGTSFMNGNAVVSVFTAPLAFNVTGGGNYCSGGAGIAVGLDGSETGIIYELYLDGTSTGLTLTGDGAALTFGLLTSAGTYTVEAAFACGPVAMNGNAVITVNTPVFVAFDVTGGGVICPGGAGVSIGLSGSEAIYSYELYLNAIATGNILAGTGSALDFGTFNTPGTYTVVASDICGTAYMNGNATIYVNANPIVFDMTGGGSFCTGETGFDIGIDGSEIGVTYELFLDGITTGNIIAGTGNAVSFGQQTVVGTYTANAHGPCSDIAMNGNATITSGASVTVFDVLGGGSYFAGGIGVEVSLSGSETSVNYQLLLNGNPLGSAIAGTGAPISFGNQTLGGTYTVNAIVYGNNCELMMNGGATVTVIPVMVDQPNDTSIFAGFGASFTVNALGATLYQWQISTDGGLTFNNIPEGNPFFNVNTTSLDIFGAPLSFSGYKFRCVVSNPGSPLVISNAGTLIVTITPTLTTIAPTMTAAPGTLIAVPITVLGFDNVAAFNLTMTYDASVMTPAGIQNINGALTNGNEVQVINTSIPGQFLMAYYSMTPVNIGSGTLFELLYNFIDGSTPLIWQLTPAEGAQYGTLFGQVIPSIWINGQINSTNSIVITDQPDNATACEGGSVTYSVTAPGATTYQWVVTTDYGLTWIPLMESPMFVGVNTNNLVVNGVSSTMSNFMFACRIDQGLTTAVVSNLASLNIVTYDVIPATIAINPSNIICPGTNVTLSVTSPVDLTGASYIWYVNSIPVSSSATYSTTGLLNGDVIKVDVMLSATCVVAEVPTVTMIVDPQPVVTTDPVDAIVVVGDDPTFSVTATAITGPVAYQWQISTDGGLTFTDLAEGLPYTGVNTATLQITDATLVMDGNQFRCIVTESLCGNTDISGNAILYVFPAPIITYAPDIVICDEEQIIVPITVDNFASVASMSLKLDYDPAVLSYVGYQNTNPLLTPAPPASYMLNIANAGSQVSIFWFSLTPVTIANGELITELVFNPANPGTSPLTWDPTFGSCMYTTLAAIPIPDLYVNGSVTINPLPIVYNVTGGGEYCIGGIGVEVGLSGSETGINYELYLNLVSTGLIVPGTGSSITFGNQLLAGDYTVVATNATTGCISDMNGFANIIINPLPVVTWTNALTTQCQSSEVYVLTGGTPAGGTYSGPGVTGNNFNAFVAGPGLHTLTYTYMDDNGCVNSATNTIFVIDGPDPFPVTGGGTFCQGGQGVTVGLSNSEPTIIYQLFINGINSGSPVFGTGGVINFGYQTVPGVYTVVGLNIFNGCTQLMIGSVTVTEIIPNVTWPTVLPALCQNSSPFTLTGGLPAGGTYSGNGVVGGVFDPSLAGNGVHVLTYTYTDTYGCTGSATNSIVVNPGPQVTFSPLPDICLTGSAFDLNTYVTPLGGTFSGAGVSGSMFDPTVAGAGPHTITYTYASNNCSVIINRTINVLSLPVVTWSNTLTPQCIDVTGYFLTGGTPAGGVYSGTGVTGNVFNPSLAGVGTHILTYTFTDSNGCVNATTNTITVNPLPTVTWTDVLPDQCVNLTSFVLTGGTPADGVYSGPGVSGTIFNPNLAGIGIHTITYTYTDPLTNCTNFTTNTITVTPVPVVTFNTLPEVCYNASPVNLSTFVTPVGGTFTGTGVTGDMFDPAVAGVGIHTITYTYPLNGCTVIVSRNINVVPAPPVSWLMVLPSQCESVTAYYLSGGLPAGGFYSGPGVVGNLFNPSLLGPGTYTLTYTYTDPSSGCTGSVNNTITVNSLPVVTWTTTAISVCVDGAPVTLAAAPAGGIFSGPGVVGNTFDPGLAGTGIFTLTYTYTDGNGCSSSADLTATVNPLPVVTFAGTLPPVCVSSTTYVLTSGTPAGGTYSGPGVTGTNFDASVAGVGTHTIIYTYTDGNGCTNSATNSIVVLPNPVVTWPTVFTAVCVDGDPFILTGGLPAGGIYSGPGVVSNVFNPALAGAGVHTLTYTFTDGFGCTNSITNSITVNALPVITWAGPLADMCITATPVTLSGALPAGGTYSGTGVAGGIFDPGVAGAGNFVITYTYTDPTTGCTNSETKNITVNDLPIVTFTGSFQVICSSSTTFNLSTGSPAGGTYSGPGVSGTNFDASVAGVGTHTITYTYTDPATGCTNSATNTITVSGAPIVTWTGALPSACANEENVALTGGLPAGGVYSGPGVTGNVFNANLTGPGTFTLTYTYIDNTTGCSGTATNTITVNALPNVTFTGTLDNQCITATSYTLTGGSPAGGNYSGSGVIGNSFNATVAGLGIHVITYTYTDGNGCTNSATNTITVVNLPVVTFNTALNDLCITSTTYTLTGGSPAGGVYSGPGVTGTNFDASVAGVGTHVITYTYTDPNGCINSATNSITVHNLPSVTFGGTLVDQCVTSTTYLLTGGLPGGGNYSGPGVSGNNFNASVAGFGLHTITYTYTDGYGCTSSATNTINVVPAPAVTWTTALTPQCETETTYLLSGGTPIGGVYSGPGVNGTNFNAALVGSGTYTLTYTYTNSNGCVGTANNTIVVNALPNVVWNTVLAPQCLTTTAYVLTGGTPAGGTYSGPGVTGNTFNASAVGIGTYTLTYTYTDPTTGCTNSTTNIITVQGLPPVYFPGILPDQCVSSTNLVLNTGVPAGGTYSGPGVTGNNFNASVAGVGTWTITYTYTNGAGCTNSATNTVTVHPLPVVTWSNALTAQCAANTTYALTGGLPLGGVYSGPGVSGTNFNASLVGVGTYTLTYTFTDGNNCVNTANNTITVVAMPTVDIGPDQGVCFGSTTTLTATATPATVSYLWNTSAITQSISVIAGDTTTYYVTVTTTDGCTAVDSVVVIPLPLPDASATANPITICSGESTILSAGGGSGTTPYLWNTTSTLQTFVTGPLTDTTFFTVTVTNTYGCKDIATVRVNVNKIPIVTLGADIIACENYTVTLVPTGEPMYDNFLWNTGAETPTLAVDSTGYGLNNPSLWTVTVTLNGCQAKDQVVVTFVPCPGFEEVGKDEKIVVYPNPTDGQFTVSIENFEKPLQFDIYNNIGQLLYSEKLQNNSQSKFSKDFDLSRYPTGFYILRFSDGDKVRSKKLIVK